MGSLVGAGAGAAEGLQSYLMQLLREQQMQQQQAAQQESARHNLASEELGQMQLGAQLQTAAATRAAAAAKEAQDTQEKLRTSTRANLDDLMPGVMITPDTRNEAVKIGAAAPERFKPFDVPKLAESSYVSPEAQAQDQQDPVAYFLQGQPKQQATPASMSQDTMLLDGKPTDVLVDRTQGAKGRVFTLQGQDVTDRVSHYERPRPDPVDSLVQSADGYITKSEAMRRLAAGENVPLATSQSTRSMMEGAQMLLPHVPELENIATELDKRGQFGPISGRIRDLSARFGATMNGDQVHDGKQYEMLGDEIQKLAEMTNDRLVGQFVTSLGLMTSGVGRVHGGSRGGGSIQMINYLKSLLSGTSSLPLFLGRMDAIDSYLKTYAKGPAKANDPGAAPQSQDQLILDEIRKALGQGQP